MDSVPMSAVADGVVVVAADGEVLAASDAASRFAAVDPPLAGRPFGEAYPDLGSLCEGAAGDRDGARAETWLNDGVEDRYVSARAVPAPPGTDGDVVVTFQDVTEGRDRDVERYETIVDALPDPVYATDAEGTLRFVNPAFEEKLGYGRAAVERGEVHFDDFATEEDTAAVLDALRRMMRDDVAEGSSTIELTGVTADGRRIPFEDTFALLPHGERFGGSAGVLRDVSDRRRRQEVLNVTNRALRHNLRTQVNTIVGYTDVMSDRLDDDTADEFDEYLDRINDSAMWLSKLGDTLRRLQEAIEEARGEDVDHDLGRIVEAIAEEYREEYPDAVVETNVREADRVRAGNAIRYPVANLIENAIVHNDGDRPEVTVWVADAPREGWMDLIVEDDGPGIPDGEKAVVLGDEEETQLRHGSGLGLWLTRWIVEVFDGEVRIRDNDPTGTVVTLRLPRVAAGGES